MRDLDELDEEELTAELERRAVARTAGLCDYCGRSSSTTSCKFPERHRQEQTEQELGEAGA